MRPLQIGLLVALGGLCGAALMKWQAVRHRTPTDFSIAMTPAVPTTADRTIPIVVEPPQPGLQPPVTEKSPSGSATLTPQWRPIAARARVTRASTHSPGPLDSYGHRVE